MSYSYEDALRLSAPQEWQQLGTEDKVEILQVVENHAAKEQRRLPCEVKSEPLYAGEDGIELGHYDLQTGDITVNESQLEPGSQYGNDADRMVETVFHEGRHAFQDQAVRGYVDVDAETKTEWANNMSEDGYIRYEANPKGYWNQPVEKDARAYAEDRMEVFCEERNALTASADDAVAVREGAAETQNPREVFESQLRDSEYEENSLNAASFQNSMQEELSDTINQQPNESAGYSISR